MADKIKALRFKQILTLITVVALVGMAYALRHQISETISNLGNVNTWALLLMIPLEVLNYHAQAKLYHGIFAVLKHDLQYKFLYRLSLELNFVNNLFPSGGVSGFSYFGIRMRSQGVSAAKATLGQLMKMILVYIAFQALLFFGVFLLAIDGRASGLLILVAGSLVTLLFVGTFGLVFIIGSKRRINSFFTFVTKLVNRIIHIVRPKHPETINIARAEEVFAELHDNYMVVKRHLHLLREPLVYGLLANLTEVAVIYSVYLAFGHVVNPGVVIIAYAVANFAGLVSVLPGGVGIYEALMTAVLAAGGISPAISLPVTVMYRVLNMLLQLPPGYILYQRALQRGPTHDDPIAPLAE
jgi:uncharacterized protein (TIRG00374 family)